jgi:aromatic ring-opening dioxygenase LigB subunit
MINFACFAPHPPLLLPDVGSSEDREKVKKTIENLKLLGRQLKQAKPDTIIISSPHSDWGFNVPLYFLAKDFKGEIKTYLIELESPTFWFEKGKKVYSEFKQGKNYALIASGDLSHCLKEDGPYGFHPDGPKFDKALIEFLKKKDVKQILKLNKMFPQSANCGLPSFSFLLGILEASGFDWEPEILSYECPFGVGYLAMNFKL